MPSIAGIVQMAFYIHSPMLDAYAIHTFFGLTKGEHMQSDMVFPVLRAHVCSQAHLVTTGQSGCGGYDAPYTGVRLFR